MIEEGLLERHKIVIAFDSHLSSLSGSVSPSTEKNTTVDCSGKRNDEQVLPKYALASNALRKVASDGQSV